MSKLEAVVSAVLVFAIAMCISVAARLFILECSSSCDVCVVHVQEDAASEFECKMEDVSRVQTK